ncbi:hypothetical protein E4T56_gene15864 [Termitomyces sp. T112]|nr:hypothetical protein E4T56_gene15864 [Termitomyces sp. T112]
MHAVVYVRDDFFCPPHLALPLPSASLSLPLPHSELLSIHFLLIDPIRFDPPHQFHSDSTRNDALRGVDMDMPLLVVPAYVLSKSLFVSCGPLCLPILSWIPDLALPCLALPFRFCYVTFCSVHCVWHGMAWMRSCVLIRRLRLIRVMRLRTHAHTHAHTYTRLRCDSPQVKSKS